MEAKWIAHNGAPKLILFFCGWGFDERCVGHLDTCGYDVVALYDYRSLQAPVGITDGYSDITVVAWSFGVWVANRSLALGEIQANKAFAIAGSTNPVSDTEGIPIAIFTGTVATLSVTSMSKFISRICGGARRRDALVALMPQRDFYDQKEELISLKQHFDNWNTPNNTIWTSALIATNDGIFSYKNLARHWGDKAITINDAHLCFGNISSWHQLLQLFEPCCNRS